MGNSYRTHGGPRPDENVKEPECMGNSYTSGSDILELLSYSSRTRQNNLLLI